MRTLAIKLTLSFLGLGLVLVALVAGAIRWQTTARFDEYVDDTYRRTLIDELVGYYGVNNSWDAVGAFVSSHVGGDGPGGGLSVSSIADAGGVIVYGGPFIADGAQMTAEQLSHARPLMRAQGGEITVASVPGEGATLRITLPPAPGP